MAQKLGDVQKADGGTHVAVLLDVALLLEAGETH